MFSSKLFKNYFYFSSNLQKTIFFSKITIYFLIYQKTITPINKISIKTYNEFN